MSLTSLVSGHCTRRHTWKLELWARRRELMIKYLCTIHNLIMFFSSGRRITTGFCAWLQQLSWTQISVPIARLCSHKHLPLPCPALPTLTRHIIVKMLIITFETEKKCGMGLNPSLNLNQSLLLD